MRLFWGILGLLLLTLSARADTIYDVSGTATLTGNDVCAGQQCVETFSFSFQLDETLSQFGYMLDEVPGGMVDATGPLGTPNLPAFHGDGELNCDRECYVAIYFGQHSFPTEFDLGITNYTPQNFASPTPFVPAFDAVDTLYSCGDSACLADFCNEPGPFGCSPPVIDWGPVTSTVTEVTSSCVATPEPQTWAMLWIGLVGLALMKFASRGKRLKASLPFALYLEPARPAN